LEKTERQTGENLAATANRTKRLQVLAQTKKGPERGEKSTTQQVAWKEMKN